MVDVQFSYDGGKESYEDFTFELPKRRRGLRRRRPSLETVLSEQEGLPPYSLLLGLCTDELPLVLDLTESSGGAFLIAGDSGFDNTTLVHSILSAACLANSPANLSVHLISPHADDLLQFHRLPHFKISFEPYRPEIAVVLEEMVNLVQSRSRTGVTAPVHVFAVDGLDLLWQALTPAGRMHLDWLIEHGPAVGVWVFATIESTYISKAIAPTIDLFDSRILGPVSQPNLARYLSGLGRSYLADLEPGEQYLVRTHGNSFTIWMLQSDNIPI